MNTIPLSKLAETRGRVETMPPCSPDPEEHRWVKVLHDPRGDVLVILCKVCGLTPVETLGIRLVGHE